MKNNRIDLTEESDFHYVLELMLPLYNEPSFAWLPELFSTIGCESLINLCKYAGGETIRIPTVEQLSDAVSAFEWYYKVWVTKQRVLSDIPANLHPLVEIIAKRFSDA